MNEAANLRGTVFFLFLSVGGCCEPKSEREGDKRAIEDPSKLKRHERGMGSSEDMIPGHFSKGEFFISHLG